MYIYIYIHILIYIYIYIIHIYIYTTTIYDIIFVWTEWFFVHYTLLWLVLTLPIPVGYKNPDGLLANFSWKLRTSFSYLIHSHELLLSVEFPMLNHAKSTFSSSKSHGVLWKIVQNSASHSICCFIPIFQPRETKSTIFGPHGPHGPPMVDAELPGLVN